MQVKKIVRHGHTKAVTIPEAWAKQLGLKLGDYVEIACVSKDTICIRKLNQTKWPKIKLLKK